MFDWLGPLVGIVLVDLVLSGDNAVVIGAAAAGLPRQQRLAAIVVGGGAAIVLRIFFAFIATVLMQMPFLGVIGAIILLFVAVRLLVVRSNEQRRAAQESQAQGSGASLLTRRKNFLASILTILVADVTMSLDNVLAIGGLAAGNLPFIAIGLLLSIALLLIGSALISELIARLPWLLDIACLVVGWTAANIFLGDDLLNPVFAHFPWIQIAAPVIALLFVFAIDLYLRWRGRLDHMGRKH